MGALSVDPALAISATDAYAAFSDGGKYRIAVAVIEKAGAFAGACEYPDRIIIFISPSAREGESQEQQREQGMP